MWLNTEEALTRLGTKPQSLYASVSRGRIQARPDPADTRRSLYNSQDVDRLAARRRGRRAAAAVAAETINWGEPVLSSAISNLVDGRLYYRGHDAVAFSQTATLETAMLLLWGGPPGENVRWPSVPPGASFAAALSALAARAAVDPPTAGRSGGMLRADAASVHATLAEALLGPGDGPLHLRLAARFERPEAADVLRRALVLFADHELNVSAFAARVVVSSGASLAAGTLAGLASLSGPLHGNASRAVTALAEDIGRGSGDIESALGEWLGEGRAIPGMGHRLYPRGDVRAEALLASFEMRPGFRALLLAAEALSGERANIDFALAAMAERFDLAREAPFTVFALARSAGWLAHMLEQAERGVLIRPRARYVGEGPAIRQPPGPSADK